MATQERWQISYIENEQGIHAVIGEYSVCGSAWDELNGVETMCPIISCPDCVGIIRNLRRVHTRRPTTHAAVPSQSISEEDNEALENMPLDPDKGG